MKPTLIQFGAGNVGRAVMAPIFLDAGYQVTFVDIDEDVVDRINEVQCYTIVERETGHDDNTLEVGPVAAVNGRDVDSVVDLIFDCDLVATSVGGGALGHVAPVIADGIQARLSAAPDRTLDIIVAENVRDGADVLTRLIAECARDDDDWRDRVGISAASIERAVPLMSAEERAKDPLRVVCEPANGLIIDRKAFRGEVPKATDLRAVDDIRAYIDRKILLFNMAHAATAYIGHRHDAQIISIAQAIEITEIRRRVRDCIAESTAGLAGAYSRAYSVSELLDYGDELLGRFSNAALGDTITRVGRDLMRKLSRGDRMLGAMLLAAEQGRPCSGLAYAVHAAFDFRRTDDEALAEDAEFFAEIDRIGIPAALRDLSGLRDASEYDRRVIEEIENVSS